MLDVDQTANDSGDKRKDDTPRCEYCGGEAGYYGGVPRRFCTQSCAKKAWYARKHPDYSASDIPAKAAVRKKYKPRNPAPVLAVPEVVPTVEAVALTFDAVRPRPVANELYIAEYVVALSRIAPPEAIDALMAAWRKARS
jgi:hypothetical protein